MKELNRALSPYRIQKIYDKGNKIAICFNEDTYIDTLKLIYMDSGVEYDENTIECREEFFIRDEELYIKANRVVVVEDVKLDCDEILESLFIVHPFIGKNSEYCSEFYTYRHFLEDLNIADMVYEV